MLVSVAFDPVETRYMRSDQHTINGLTAYKLGTSNTVVYGSVSSVAKSVSKSATLYPTSDAITCQWSVYPVYSPPHAHYTYVDETPPNTNDYVYTSANAKYEAYDHTSYTLPSGYKVALVRIVAYTKISRDADADVLAGVRIGTTYYVDYTSSTSSWDSHIVDFPKNPATNQQWTQSDINGAKIALFSEVYSGAVYCSTVWMEIYVYQDDTVYYAVDVAVRNSAGSETVIGNKVAQWNGLISSLYDSYGLKSATWNCPQTSLTNTDAIVVRVYQKIGSGSWTLAREFITEQLGAQSLDAATWTVYYYLDISADTSYVYIVFWHGTTAYNSRIENFTWTSAITKSWHDISIYTFNLLTKTWNQISIWDFTLSVKAWNQIATWILNAAAKSWHSTATWSFNVLTKAWRSITTWQMDISTIGKAWHIISFWNLYVQLTITERGIPIPILLGGIIIIIIAIYIWEK